MFTIMLQFSYNLNSLKGYIENIISPRNIKKEAISMITEGHDCLIKNIVSNSLNKIDSVIVGKNNLKYKFFLNQFKKNFK